MEHAKDREKHEDKQHAAKEAPKKEEPQRKTDDKGKKTDELNLKIDELTDTLKRLQAEFENYKKRVEKDKAEFVKYSSAIAVERLLPVLDSFEIALKNADQNEKFVQGMKMIYGQIVSTFESMGLRPIKAENEMYDPYRHEVLMKEESDKPEGTILEEFQKGYMFHDKVLRFSKVKISGK